MKKFAPVIAWGSKQSKSVVPLVNHDRNQGIEKSFRSNVKQLIAGQLSLEKFATNIRDINQLELWLDHNPEIQAGAMEQVVQSIEEKLEDADFTMDMLKV